MSNDATVMCAPLEDSSEEYVGKSIKELAEELGENLEIPEGGRTIVENADGRFEASAAYHLKPGDTLIFERFPGREDAPMGLRPPEHRAGLVSKSRSEGWKQQITNNKVLIDMRRAHTLPAHYRRESGSPLSMFGGDGWRPLSRMSHDNYSEHSFGSDGDEFYYASSEWEHEK